MDEVAGKTQITNKPRASAGFSDRKQTINGNSNCHVAEYEDFHTLQLNCQFAYGVLYDDESTETSFDVKDIYSYAYYNASNKNKGMRGCFVYNPKGSTNSGGEGANLFFPTGSPDTAGVRTARGRAANAACCAMLTGALYTSSDLHYRPMLYTVYTNFGRSTGSINSRLQEPAWDINVSTFDFSFNNNAFLVSDWGAGDVSDACFVRLVE
ncbi:MAG: hypothetical protein ACLTSJ_09915 [Alistipes communis]